MAKNNGDGELNLLVKFGGVSIGEKTARLGMTIAREQLNLTRADKTFCDRRLIGKVVLGIHDEDATQGKLLDVDHEVAGAFDVKGYKVSADAFGIGATFSKQDVSINELSQFASGSGRLIVTSAGEIPEPLPAEPPIKTNGAPTTLRAKGPWRKVNLDTLFDPDKTIRKAFANAGIDTMGQLSDYTGAGKLLADIDGLGPKKVEDVENRLEEFWKSNPDADAQPAEAAAE